jgi:phytoene dehydrogenase-like protein
LTATIEKNGFQWDLGQLLIEGLGQDEPLGKVFQDLGIFEKIPAKADFRGYVFPDYEIRRPEIYSGLKWRMHALEAQFPDEAKGLKRYWRDYVRFTRVMTLARRMESAKGLARLMGQLRLYLALLPLLPKTNMNATQWMDHYFKNEALKMVFISILADFFTPPSLFQGLGVFALNSELSFEDRMPANIGKNALQLSLYSLKGGIKNLIKPLVNLIQSEGGVIHLEQLVEKIVVENNTAKGIVVKGECLPADVIIASGSARSTFFDLVEKDKLPPAFAQLVADQKLMDGVFMVHLGLNMDPRPYVHGAVTYYYGTYDLENGIENARSGHYHGGEDGFVVHVPTLHSPEMAPQGQHAMTIYTICPNTLAEGDWEKDKESWAHKLITCAADHIPGLEDHIVEKVIMTPVDFQKRAHLEHFAFGGLCPVMHAPRIPHHTPLDGLWFIGQQSESGGGVNNVLLASYQTAQKIEKTHGGG